MERIRSYFSSALKFIKDHRIISVFAVVLIAGLILVFKPKGSGPIPTEKIERGKLVQTISITGSVQAENIAKLTFKTAGKLVYLGAKEGDAVQTYQTIAALDQQTVQKNLRAALIDYSIERLTFEQTQANNQNRTIQGALNDDMRRILQNNQYDLDKAINSVELIDLAKQDSVITTPIGGIVVHEDVSLTGINISPLTTFTIIDPTSLTFEMDADEADVGKIKNGDKISVALDAYPNDNLNLKVESIDFVSHSTSTGGTAFTVKAKLNSSNISKYRIGMSGNADITTNEKDNVLSVPISSIYNDNKVYVKKDGKFEERTISSGLETDLRVEVKSGLSENDEVVTDPSKVKK